MMPQRPTQRSAARLLCTAAAIVLIAASPLSHAAAPKDNFEWQLPIGFPQPAVPPDNPMSQAKVALGRQLFSDVRLSVTGQHSCASCHDPLHAFTDGRAVAIGATGATLTRNAPSLFNAAYNASLGWDAPGDNLLEKQMRRPLFNAHPVELGLAGRERQVEQTLMRDASFAAAFAAAFPLDPAPITMPNIIRAIATFERTLLAGNSRFDRYVFRGEHAALTAAEKHGMELFFSARAGCSACHSGLFFNGPWVDANNASASALFARNSASADTKRVPTLRDVSRTPPYMHDGRLATLQDVLAHYERVALDGDADARLRRAPLSQQEQTALLAFLSTLESTPSAVGAGK